MKTGENKYNDWMISEKKNLIQKIQPQTQQLKWINKKN